MIKIMNLRNSKPSEPYDFYIDRRTSVGNPFTLVRNLARDEVCDMYDRWFKTQQSYSEFWKYMSELIEAYGRYDKLRLFCWCAPKRCHGETIKNYIQLIPQ